MRVLISGGGIAGLTLAYWLHRYDIEPVVIEQAKSIRHDGYAIDFFGAGYDVAERMGLIDQLRSRQIPYECVAYVNEAGEPVAKLDKAMIDKFTDGKYMGLMHATLEEVLYEALEGRVEVRFGRSLTAIEQKPDQVSVTFNDGSTESFDLLIGADGVHSITRTLIFGPEKQFSRFLGYTIACYTLADRYSIDQAWKMYVEPRRMVGAFCGDHEGDIFATLIYQTDRVEHLPREQRLPRLREVFAGMGWVTQELLSNVRDTENIFMDAVTQIQMPIWHAGRVALVGDACGCPTLMSGQGACLAMGGAYILAEALHQTTDYQDAFRRYEQRMRPHVEKQQKSGRDFAKWFVPGSELRLKVQVVMLQVLMQKAFIGLLGRRLFGTESIL